MKLSKREKVLLILLLVIGGSLAYIFLFYIPTTNEINDLNSQIQSNQAIISTNELLKKQIDKTVQGISDNEKKIREFGAGIDSAFDQPPVLVYLYNTMNKYGKKVQINFGNSGSFGQVNHFDLSVTMIAKYDGLKSILKTFSEDEYFLKVTSINARVKELTSEEDSKKEEDKKKKDTLETDLPLSISMDLEFYYIGDRIPPDKVYDFASGAVQYGGNIFG